MRLLIELRLRLSRVQLTREWQVLETAVAERACWLAWSQIEGVGPVLMRRLQKQFGSLAAAWAAEAEALLAVEGFGLLTVSAVGVARSQVDPDQLLQQHEQENPQFWTPADADYPRLLLEIPDLPAVLYYDGRVDQAENQGSQPIVALVGTRSPSDYGKRWTRRLTTALVHNGFTVISGLADGVDTEAHRCCVELGGRTIGVLGTGVDVTYPWSNRSLQRQVAAQGLLLSEYPAGTKPDRIHFPRRNRIIAGLSRATIVLEAPLKSGALITAHQANDYGRDVYVLPGSLDNSRAIGCLDLLHKGAQVILGEDHLLEMLGTMPQLNLAVPKPVPLPLNLPPEQTQILQALTQLSQESNGTGVPFDLIVQTVGLAAGTVSSTLLQLELAGWVAQQPGMRYCCCAT